MKKLGIYLTVFAMAASIFNAVSSGTSNFGETVAWITAAAWAGISFILEIKIYNNGNSNTTI